ncbi:MAG: dehydrogenase, partial [Candidatus Omnitrophica bacterium]|nr:dehydrogenase [Candidatus Omnitrophota bacterium]
MRGARHSFIGFFLVGIFCSLQTAESEDTDLQPLLRSEVLAQEARSLTHLDEINPYAFGLHSAKLTTPQWIGEEGVESAVVLSIDDLSDATKYENYLRPILNRLKEIDGRAGMTITANRPKPDEPLIQKWLEEGVSIEAHTTKHACPMLCKSDLAENKADYDQCVDLLFSIPNNEPVGFRVPCCDSMNATSPCFFAELFGKTTPNGNFLTLDSSVFTIFTPDDPALPKDLVEEPDGRGRFQKYVPEDRGFVNSIENYPYPYTIGNFCWELPGVMPSDWNAFHFHEAYNPYTVEDLQSAIDITAIKQGLFTLVFHPHGWIRNDQIVSLIDHAVFHHGNKIKFLSFKEVSDRLTENLLLGQSIRNEKGEDNGVRILDLNGDGFMDVVIGNDNLRITRVWNPEKNEWIDFSFPVSFHSVDGDGNRFSNGIRFGIFGENSQVGFLYANGNESRGWLFDGSEWVEEKDLVPAAQGFVTATGGKDTGVRLIDLNGDGSTELLNGWPNAGQVFVWKSEKWESLPFSLPKNVQIVDNQGGDFGTRFVDLDDDLDLDLVCSNEKESVVYLFQDMETGWGDAILDEKPGSEDALPLIARDGTNNGAWFHSRALWVNNENTDQLENKVAKKTFNEMLRDARLPSKSKEAALKSIHTRPGFEVELVAAEPFVKDPVAYSWGPDGKLWVVEMADYPEGIDNEGKPGGRVRYLEDADRDGDYDRSTLFLDGLTFPNGILPWHDGVLITSAPDILYAEDTDGDGKADRKETLYTGFGNINEQHLINGLRWGLDNWVYCANGDSGGDIRSLKTGKTVELRGRDLRLKPDEGLLE